ncbi:MAG: GIY-YIG nuclease family protein [Campylobacterota bacterium]|nr:GIY-YIG nuclease family protein [Campylobacterota bacterium]
MLYIAHIEKAQRGNSNKLNRRTTLIFENATQSNMLHRSLGKRLKDNGKMVTKLDEEVLKNLDQTNDKNKPNGYIYILESLSNDDKITTKKDLYKIGFSTTSVEQRIKNAKNDPTYLMADVKIIQTYKVYDSNPHKLEKLIHKFFSHCCLNVDIVDAKGNLYNPKEWFIVPLNTIEEAIELIKNRRIINYKYDYEIEKIIKK